MHGNRVITEYAPGGRTSETVFAMAGFSSGIQQGITIGLLARIAGNEDCVIRYRDDINQASAEDRRAALLASLDDREFASHYETAAPNRDNRFSFRPRVVSADYLSWPTLPELAEAEPFSGLSEKRKGALIDVGRAALELRMRRYLDPALSFETVRATGSGPVADAAAFRADSARERIVAREPFDPTRIKRYAMMPFDQRWAYHTNEAGVWNRSRPEFAAQVRDDNLFIVSRMVGRRPEEGLPVLPTRALANHHLLDPNAHAISRQGAATASCLRSARTCVPTCRHQPGPGLRQLDGRTRTAIARREQHLSFTPLPYAALRHGWRQIEPRSSPAGRVYRCLATEQHCAVRQNSAGASRPCWTPTNRWRASPPVVSSRHSRHSEPSLGSGAARSARPTWQ